MDEDYFLLKRDRLVAELLDRQINSGVSNDEEVDYLIAKQVDRELNSEVSSDAMAKYSTPKGKENRPLTSKLINHEEGSLVDPDFELIDPTPDIRVLFIQFDKRFFWESLGAVEVKWSPRMTSCAGVCVYQGRGGLCSVRLSLPLLKLRPRQDLVETLLHEMIHAYLFVTNNNRDRDGHGPEFHKHMYRINKEAGTNITVYHSFHDEVRLYKQHWWRCDGPCHKQPPYFGTVRRATNRAPAPSDSWWDRHARTCGGKFIKIKSPENTKESSKNSKKSGSSNNGKPVSGKGDIRSFFPTSPIKTPHLLNPSTIGGAAAKPGGSQVVGFGDLSISDPKSNGSASDRPSGKSVGNNVFGFRDLGGSTSASAKPPSSSAVNNVVGFRDLGGAGYKKPAGTSQSGGFGGKGYTLGGNSTAKGQGTGGIPKRPFLDKPQFKKGGGFGGMISNRSGTFVISGKTKNTDKEDGPGVSKLFDSSSVPTFTGSGNVLGGSKGKAQLFGGSSSSSTVNGSLTSVQEKPQAGKRWLPNTDKSEKRLKIEKDDVIVLSDDEDDKAHISADAKYVSCPVCETRVKEADINLHLDECVNEPIKRETESSSDRVNQPIKQETESSSYDVITVKDEDEGPSETIVDCPACNKKVPESTINDHLNECMSGSFQDDDDDPFEADKPKKDHAKCPICGEDIVAAKLGEHLENCASCSIQDLSGVFDEDFSEDEEEDAAVGTPSKRVSEKGERLYPCPCCLDMVEPGKMSEHLDSCMLR